MEVNSSPPSPALLAPYLRAPGRGRAAVPHFGARLFTPPGVAAMIAAMGAELLLAHSLLLLLPASPERLRVVGVASVAGMLLSAALVRVASRARDATMALVWCAAGGAALGWAEAAIVGGASAFVRQLAWPAVVLASIQSATSGTMLFLPIGLTLGLACAVIVVPAARAHAAPSFDSVDRLVAAGGAWLATLGLLLAYLGSGSALSLLAGGATLVGVVLTLTGQVRTEDRVAWLRRVQAGHEPRFVIDARDDATGGAPPLVADLDTSLQSDGVLLAVDPARPGYRSADLRLPLATVPLDAAEPLPTAWGGRLDAAGHCASTAGLVRRMGATVALSAGSVLLVTVVTRGMQQFFQLAGAWDGWISHLH